MKEALYASLLAIIFFSACQKNEDSEALQKKEYTVSIMARIGKSVSGPRYQQNNESTAADFIKDDDIGVFVDDDNAVRWIFDGTSWTTEKSVYWKDKDKEHAFCAYYPYSGSEAESKENIKMPSLDSQDGSWENIVRYDFLVASKSLSYNTDTGNVVFSGDYSFKHILSLLKINIKGEGDMAQAVIDEIKLEGNDLMTQGYYSFDANSVTIDGNSKNILDISPSHAMNGLDASFCFILNGTEAGENIGSKAVTNHSVNLTVKYTRNGKHYIAQRESLSASLFSGCIHEYNILVKDRSVIIIGGIITGWTPGNKVEDIIINGEEADSTNK